MRRFVQNDFTQRIAQAVFKSLLQYARCRFSRCRPAVEFGQGSLKVRMVEHPDHDPAA
jgi:hypothetical protein